MGKFQVGSWQEGSRKIRTRVKKTNISFRTGPKEGFALLSGSVGNPVNGHSYSRVGFLSRASFEMTIGGKTFGRMSEVPTKKASLYGKPFIGATLGR